MTNDASRHKGDEPDTMPSSYSGTDSFDFIGGSVAPAAAPSNVVDRPPEKTASGVRNEAPVVDRSRKKTASGARTKAPVFSGGTWLVLVVIAIAVVVAFATTKRSTEAPVQPRPAATAPREQKASAPESTLAKVQPSVPLAPQPVQKPAWPADFLAAFQEYSGKPGSKAMALALDDTGKMAYIGVFEHATQSAANDEALSQCTRYKTQQGVQKDCRLYAVGDTIVW